MISPKDQTAITTAMKSASKLATITSTAGQSKLKEVIQEITKVIEKNPNATVYILIH
jgi:hypothetical protein